MVLLAALLAAAIDGVGSVGMAVMALFPAPGMVLHAAVFWYMYPGIRPDPHMIAGLCMRGPPNRQQGRFLAVILAAAGSPAPRVRECTSCMCFGTVLVQAVIIQFVSTSCQVLQARRMNLVLTSSLYD